MTTINKDSSLNTFRNDQYTITTSLSDHHIIVKLVNNVSYTCYEGTFDKSAFKLPFGLPAVFKLINNCFSVFVDTTDRVIRTRQSGMSALLTGPLNFGIFCCPWVTNHTTRP